MKLTPHHRGMVILNAMLQHYLCVIFDQYKAPYNIVATPQQTVRRNRE